MRYRIRVTRLQIADRTVRAADEDAAIEQIREELRQPYGFLSRWETVNTDLEVLVAEESVAGTPIAQTEAAMLLSVADAANVLGVSRGSLSELVNRGDLQSLQIGRRRLIPRAALIEFIDENTRSRR